MAKGTKFFWLSVKTWTVLETADGRLLINKNKLVFLAPHMLILSCPLVPMEANLSAVMGPSFCSTSVKEKPWVTSQVRSSSNFISLTTRSFKDRPWNVMYEFKIMERRFGLKHSTIRSNNVHLQSDHYSWAWKNPHLKLWNKCIFLIIYCLYFYSYLLFVNLV